MPVHERETYLAWALRRRRRLDELQKTLSREEKLYPDAATLIEIARIG